MLGHANQKRTLRDHVASVGEKHSPRVDRSTTDTSNEVPLSLARTPSSRNTGLGIPQSQQGHFCAWVLLAPAQELRARSDSEIAARILAAKT